MLPQATIDFLNLFKDCLMERMIPLNYSNESRSTVDATLVSTGFDRSKDVLDGDSLCCEESLESQRKTLDPWKEAAYESNVAFIRSLCGSSHLLFLMGLMVASLGTSLYITVKPLFVDGVFSFPLGLSQGAPILSFLSFLFSTLPLIGLIMLYVEAKKPYAFTGSGFHVLHQFLWFSMRLLVIAGGFLVLPFLFWLIGGFVFVDEGVLLMHSIANAFAIALVILAGIPVYRMYGAAKQWTSGLAYAIETDEFATPPNPANLLRWMQWVALEAGIIAILLPLVDFLSIWPDFHVGGIWIGVALQAGIVVVGWQLVRRYWLRMLVRKKTSS